MLMGLSTPGAANKTKDDAQERIDRSDGALRFLVPPGVATVSPAAVSVLKCARDPALAAAFVRYNLTEDGQKLWELSR